jgi:hypothetical protein
LTRPAISQAVKDATTTIPTIFVAIGDPVAYGFVPSLARPGGNLTGLSSGLLDIGTKALQILKELVPSAELIAIISNPDNPGDLPTRKAIETAAPVVGVKVANHPVLNSDDLTRAFDTLAKARPDGLYIIPDHFLFTQRERPTTPDGRALIKPVTLGRVSLSPDFPTPDDFQWMRSKHRYQNECCPCDARTRRSWPASANPKPMP